MKTIYAVLFFLSYSLGVYCQSFPPPVNRTAQSTPQVDENGFLLKKQASVTSEYTGVTFTYTIFYTIPSTAKPGAVITITDEIFPPLVVEPTNNPNITIGPHAAGAPTPVTYVVPAPDPGKPKAGDFQINVHFPAGTTCNGEFVDNHARMTTVPNTGPGVITSGLGLWTPCLMVTAVAADNSNVSPFSTDPFILDKTAVLPSTTSGSNVLYHAALDGVVKYHLTISKPSPYQGTGYGQQNLTNVIITDNFPAGAVLNFASVKVSASTGWYTSPVVTFMQIGNSIEFKVTNFLDAASSTPMLQFSYEIYYPQSIFQIGDYVGGLARFSATTCNTPLVNYYFTEVIIGAAQACGQPSKSVSITNRVPGCPGLYRLSVTNNGNVKLPDCNITDNIPNEVDVSRIVFNTALPPNVSLELRTNLTQQTIPASPPAGYTWNNTGGHISIVEVWIRNILGYGIDPGDAFNFDIYFTVAPGVPPLTNVDNTMTASFPGSPIPPITTPTVRFVTENFQPKICADKMVCNKLLSYKYGDIVRYRLRIQNIGSQTLSGADIVDILNDNLLYLGNEKYYSSTDGNIPCGVSGTNNGIPLNATPWYVLSTSHYLQRLDWQIPPIAPECDKANFYYGCYVTGVPYYFIEFDVLVKQNALAGSVSNFFTVQGGTLPVPKTSNVDFITVNSVGGLLAEKFISLDGKHWSKNEVVTPGSVVNYRLWYKNTANYPVNDVLLIDLLPMDFNAATDRMILDRPLDRGSQFDISYSRLVNTAPEIRVNGSLIAPTPTVKLNSTFNICLPEMGYSPWGCKPANPTWSTLPLGGKNVMFEFGTNFPFNADNQLKPGDILTCDYKVQVPLTSSGKHACNSFVVKSTGYYYTGAVGNLQIVYPLPVESNTACLTSSNLSIIRGYKFNDLDGDGTWDDGEPGLPDWTINLNGATQLSCVTGPDGYFEFNDLPSGFYSLNETPQYGWEQTIPIAPPYIFYYFSPGTATTISVNIGNHFDTSCLGHVDPDCHPPYVWPPDNMNNWWSMDFVSNNSTDDIEGSYNNVGILSPSTPQLVTGKVQSAMKFDNPAEYVEVADQAQVNIGPGGANLGDFTFDAWIFYPQSNGNGTATILDKLEGNYGYRFYVKDGLLHLTIGDGTVHDYYTNDFSLPLNEWSFVAVTVDRDRNDNYGVSFFKNYVYVAGVIPGSPGGNPTNQMGDLINTKSLIIGGTTIANGGVKLDEIETFTRVLTPWNLSGICEAGSYGKCKTLGHKTMSDMAITGSAQPLQCHGIPTGTIQVQVTGGTLPYAYNWSNCQTTFMIDSLYANTYTVTVTDAANSRATASFVVGEPPAMVLSGTVINATCPGLSNGSIGLSVAGGTIPYAFLWSNGAATQSISGLQAGSYAVTISDANACTAHITPIAIDQPPAMAIVFNTTNIPCNGANTGKINNTVTGGTPPYAYAWNNGAITQSISGLIAAVYTVTVTDANGCAKSQSQSVIVDPLTGTVAPFSEGFELPAFPPACWTNTVISGPYLWARTTDASGNGLGTASALADFFDQPNGTYELKTLPIDISGLAMPVVRFNYAYATYVSEIDELDISYSADNGATWHILLNMPGGTNGILNTGGASFDPFVPASSQWGTQTIPLPAGTNMIKFTAIAAYGNNLYLDNITVMDNSPFAIQLINASNALCFGTATGFIDISVSGGTQPYSYLWSNGAVTQDIGGLMAGIYSVTVTDATSATISGNWMIAEPAMLGVSGVVTDASCFGKHDGRIDISVTGGTLGYSYLWSTPPGLQTQNIDHLFSASYTVTVTDANGCTTTGNWVVGEPDEISWVGSVKQISCHGKCDGTIATLLTSGGTSPYSYMWNTMQQVPNITDLCPGTYCLTITDANLCEAVFCTTITEPDEISLTASVNPVLCAGGSSGCIDLSVSGGTTPYQYAWDNMKHTEDICNLTTGTYCVTVTDAHSCTKTDCWTVPEPVALAVTGMVTDASCFGEQDGRIDITVTGGTTAYSYLWSNPPGLQTQNISHLVSDSYTVTVTDAYGCTTTGNWVVGEPAELSYVGSVKQISCHGKCDGTITMLMTIGGTSPYSYTWNTTQQTPSLSGLCPGIYNLTVTDAHLCEARFSARITEPSEISLSASVSPVLCAGGSSGCINLSVAGGTSPYQYVWDNSKHTEDICNLTTGTYCVTVTDAHSCTKTDCWTVPEPVALAVTGMVTNASCHGYSNGRIDITVTGGTTAYSYLWSKPAMTQNINSLHSGPYTVTVTDAHFCTVTASWMVGEPAEISWVGSVKQISCHGKCDGTIMTLMTSGGTSPYSYMWNTTQQVPNIRDLCPGTYCLTITDANLCEAVFCTTITEPSEISLSASVSPVLCAGGSSGCIDLSVSGGTTPYLYVWDNSKHTQDICNLTTGTYCVTVTDAHSCTKTDCWTVPEPVVLIVTGMVTNASCFGYSDGRIDITVTGGTTAYSYLWSKPANTQNISGLHYGVYTVTVTDANNCKATASWMVGQPDDIVLMASFINILCPGGQDGCIDLSVFGGTSPYDYSWNTTAPTQDICQLAEGTYCVTVTDANGCTKAGCWSLTDPEDLVVTGVVTNPDCYLNSNGLIDITVTGGTQTYSYEWSDPPGWLIPDLCCLSPGAYTVTVTDYSGCVTTGSWMVDDPDPISWVGSVTNVTCNGKCDGKIKTISTTGGTPQYTYNWGNGPQTADISDLCAGTYCVTITDAHLCEAVFCMTVGEPAALVLSAFTTPESCAGAADGKIDLTVGGGVFNYSYQWDDPPRSQTKNIMNLVARTYCVTVTDFNSCTATGCWTVMQNKSVCSNLNLQNEIVLDTRCYSALQTIFVAGPPPGYPTTFIVANGGHATMIAGQNIIYYVGTKVLPGGYMKGKITLDGTYCGSKAISIVTNPEGEAESPPAAGKSFFTIYPNPTTGGFSLELTGTDETAELRLEIYGMHGERVQSATLNGQRKYDLSLAGKPVGVYFIRVVTGNLAGSGKIIKQ
ncbi:MAG: T9SS type A sorting domain-containing protein [Bacteroidetes bacterium]|nr:T9SS type A sorting domain-containing protein [Bacteroidota bacterium]